MFYPYEGKTDLFDINSIPKSMLIGERRSDFWNKVYQIKWKLDFPIDFFHNTVNEIGLPANLDANYVITLHDVIPYVMPETVDRPHLDYTFKNTPYIVENAAQIITVSNYSKQDIQRYFGIDDDKITVTHLAADDIYQPMDRDKARSVIFNKYGVDRHYILYLGGFSTRKNIARLIEAFKRVKENYDKPIDLLILGEHSRSYPMLWSLTEKLELTDNVKFLNFIPTSDLPFFYNGADVFVYPSLYEGFGLPPLEAMQCGTPVVSSKVSSIPEIVGDAALLANPYKTDEIAEQILKLLTDQSLWNRYSLLGQAKSKEYSWDETARKTMEVYKKCLNK
jgi:glycosyltransferase involved in cell wall biosynthesis